MEQITTRKLEEVLISARPDNVDEYLSAHAGQMADEERPFAAYMREMFREKEVRQQDVFIAADVPERYGYKIVAEMKHTTKRDVILRLCFAARFTLKEANRALKLYGVSPLYPKIPRDAVLIIAFNSGLHEIAEVDSLLETHGMAALEGCARE